MIGRLSRYLADIDNLTTVYAVVVVAVAAFGILLLVVSPLSYGEDQLYPKSIDPASSLNPYERGGDPFNRTEVLAQYPENSPYLGYVTSYLTPLSAFFAATSPYMGTTILTHPGGIIDEILYNTRGLDTVAETSILFIAFAIASFLFRREEE